MKEAEFFGGLILMGIAVYLFLFLDATFTVPLAVTFMILGVGLLAISRRREQF